MTELSADLVATAAPADLLPSRLVIEGSPLPEQLALVDAERLGTDCWLAVLASPNGARFAAPLVLSDGRLRRARPGDGVAERLLARLSGTDATPPTAFRWRRTGEEHNASGERAMGVDQTHESVVVGEEVVVKWSVAAEPSPAPDLLSHLHAVGFPDVPTPWGFVQHDDRLLVAVDGYLPGAVDGWTWCVDDLAADVVAGTSAGTGAAARLGDLLGRLHVALATPSRLLPEPVGVASQHDVDAWHTRAIAGLELARAEVTGAEGTRLQDRAARAAAAVDRLLDVDRTPVMPVHGDLHVGQVLRADGRYVVTDFDGNPVLPAEQRWRPEPAARDVAGMLQALDHVGRVVVRRVPAAQSAVVDAWIPAARTAFLDAYRTALREAGLSHLLDERLLVPFAVEQECREYAYALRHLPRWLYVPDAAFAALFPEE